MLRTRSSRTAIAVPAVLLALSLFVGCSSSDSNGPATPTGPIPAAAVLMASTVKATKALTSVHLLLDVAGTVPRLPVHHVDADLTTVPSLAAQGRANVTALGGDIDTAFIVFDSQLWANFTGTNWQSLGAAKDIYDPSILLDPNQGPANVLAHLTGAQVQGREQIDGINTIKIVGSVNGAVIRPIVKDLPATPIPTTVWVQDGGNYETVRTSLEAVPNAYVNLTLSNWNVPVTVTKPS